MMPPIVTDQVSVPLPSDHRAQARRRSTLHINALALVQTLHLLALCHLAGLFGLPESPERRKKKPLLARIGRS